MLKKYISSVFLLLDFHFCMALLGQDFLFWYDNICRTLWYILTLNLLHSYSNFNLIFFSQLPH